MVKKIVFGLFLSCASIIYADDKDLNYTEAFEKSKKENKPLVVLISAKWCPSCVTMKSDTIEPMKKDGSFKNVVVTVVDVDVDKALVEELYTINDKTKKQIKSIPQIVIFSSPKDEPKQFGLIGLQKKSRVLELLRKICGND